MTADRRDSDNAEVRRNRKRPTDSRVGSWKPVAGRVREQPELDGPPLVWAYLWEDSLNGTQPESAVPLQDRVVQELLQRSQASAHDLPLITIRGELGSGKTELTRLLQKALTAAAAERKIEDRRAADLLTVCKVIEAEDLETAAAFARKVADAARHAPVIALARPSTLDLALSNLSRADPPLAPAASAVIRPFRASTPGVFNACIDHIASVHKLREVQTQRLRKEVAELPDYLATPFYFGLIAQATADSPEQANGASSVLDYFAIALENGRTGPQTLKDLLPIALSPNRTPVGKSGVVQGIVDEDGFSHDGYRNLVLALAAARGEITIEQVGSIPNAVPAFRALIQHVSSASPDRDDLARRLTAFVAETVTDSSVIYPLYLQAVAALGLDDAKAGTGHREIVVDRCLRLLSAREAAQLDDYDARLLEQYSGAELVWDISDALEMLGDPRLQDRDFSHRFTKLESLRERIGGDQPGTRKDDAKPVRSYSPQDVEVGPVYVADYLVTNQEFDVFLRDGPEDYYVGPGRKWVDGDEKLLKEIERSFDVVAPRCFWKELEIASSPKYKEMPSALNVARNRALRQNDGMLRDRDSASDERFSSPGKPVVGVTWWDAIAYCNWWGEKFLPGLGLPARAEVSLLSDWEWEAIRRHFFDAGVNAGGSGGGRTFPAHLKTVRVPHGAKAAMRLLQPVHVGIFPRPLGKGPFDLVGNVWEWTRSRVFGKIVLKPNAAKDAPFGGTRWDHGDAAAEQIARAPDRDALQPTDPLAYRAVRGGSWFSSDEDAAWDPAYRLCDPPYSSYWDLGFRIAIYPEGLPNDR